MFADSIALFLEDRKQLQLDKILWSTILFISTLSSQQSHGLRDRRSLRTFLSVWINSGRYQLWKRFQVIWVQKKKLRGEMIDCKSLDYLLSCRLGQDFELSHFSFLNSSSICSLGWLAWSGNTVLWWLAWSVLVKHSICISLTSTQDVRLSAGFQSSLVCMGKGK